MTEDLCQKKTRQAKRAYLATFISNRWYLNILYRLILLWLPLLAALFIIEFLPNILPLKETTIEKINDIKTLLSEFYLYYNIVGFLKLIWGVLVLLIVKWSRKFIYFIIKGLFPVFKKLFAKEAQHLLERYYLMGRFTFYMMPKIYQKPYKIVIAIR